MITELLVLLASLFIPEICNATTFAQPGDKWLGGDSPVLRRKILPTDNGVAHREFPLGRWVSITSLRTGETTEARVIDRGPFGRIDEDGDWYNGVEVFREANRAGEDIPKDGWRGCLDMTPRVANAIDADGFEPVVVHLLPKKRKRKRRKHAPRRPSS